MDDSRFDDLARSLAGQPSRRHIVRGLLGAVVVAVTGGAGMRGGRSRAQDGLATPELTVEVIDPTEAPPDPTLAATETTTIDPTMPPTATATATATSTPTATTTATPTAADPLSSAGVRATPTLVVSPLSAKVGGTIAASITGFPARDGVQFRLYTGASFVAVGSGVVNGSGVGSFNLLLPAVTSGRHLLRAQGTSVRADAYIEIKRSTKLSPTTGPRGTTVTITLRGFKASKEHRILFYSFDTRTGSPLELKRITTSSTGSASTTVTIPTNALFTKHRIEAVESGGTAYAGAFFTVPQPAATPTPTSTPLPRVFTLSPPTGPRGTVVSAQLRNFTPNASHQIRFYSTDAPSGTPLVLASLTTNSAGAADTIITIPGNALFTRHLLEAKETSGTGLASAYFTVPEPVATSTPTPTATPTVTCKERGAFCGFTSECCDSICFHHQCV